MSEKDNNVGQALKNKLKTSFARMLLDILSSIPGPKKDIVLDPHLISCLDQFASINDLKAKGVEKIYKLEPGLSPGSSTKCVYIVRPLVTYIKFIADQIRADKNQNKDCKYWILFVPQKLYSCELILEQEGVYGDVTIMEFPLGLIPLDQDFFSLELQEFFPSYFLNGDLTWIHSVAMSFLQLEMLIGQVPHIFAHGNCSKIVLDKLKFLQKENIRALKVDKPMIDHAFIIDRDLDYVSLLLSQLTYEGLLDEVFGINSGKIMLGSEVTKSDAVIKHSLINDQVFKEIKNHHFTNVFSHLKQKGQQIQNKYDEGQAMGLDGMKKFVSNELKNLKQQHASLSLHIGACEAIMKRKNKQNFDKQLQTEYSIIEGVDLRDASSYVEELIHRQFSSSTTLRLIGLLSLCQGGLNSRDYKNFVTCYLQSYGYQCLTTIHNLNKLGVLTEQDSSKVPVKMMAAVSNTLGLSTFRTLVKKFGLIPKTSENIRRPTNPSYVFGGSYIPLVCRLVELVMSKESFIGLEDLLKLLPGPSIHHQSGTKSSSPKSKVILVYIVGGATYAELSALRLLASIKGIKILVATTSSINGSSFLNTLIAQQ